MSLYRDLALFALAGAGGAAGKSLLDFVRREQPHVPGCDQGRADLGEWDGRADSEGRFPRAQFIGEELALRELDAEAHIERLEAALRDIKEAPHDDPNWFIGFAKGRAAAALSDLAKNALEGKP